MEERALLTSLSNPLVKHVRSLKGRKGRDESGSFLVEGLHHTGQALDAGWEVEVLFFAPDLLAGEYAAALLEKARRNGLALQPVSAQVMESLAEKENPQGILAVVKQRMVGLEDVRALRSGVALVSPQDPGNVGAILRTVDAVGAEALFLLDGGVELYHPTCVRASMGTLFWIPVVRTLFSEFTKWVAHQQMLLIGSSAHATVDYRDFDPGDSPWMLVLGNEQKGLSSEHLSACNVSLSLPMRGRVSSLNLSVAAGILLYALKK